MKDTMKHCEAHIMYSTCPHGLYSRQSGIALFVCLMILLVLSILGISAMRMSMSQSQIASSSLASGMAFQSAETAISRAISEGEMPDELNAREVLPQPGEDPIVRCVTATATTTTSSVGSCPASTFSDSKGATRSAVVIAAADPDDDNFGQDQLKQVVKTVGALPIKDMPQPERHVFTATGSVDALGIRSVNVQETIYPHL